MKFQLDNQTFRVRWEYKKRKHGRVKTTCSITRVVDEEDKTLPEILVAEACSQNNVSEGDIFNKAKGRKLSFLRAVDQMIVNIIPGADYSKEIFRNTKKGIFQNLESTIQEQNGKSYLSIIVPEKK
jgi:hypothetical protein